MPDVGYGLQAKVDYKVARPETATVLKMCLNWRLVKSGQPDRRLLFPQFFYFLFTARQYFGSQAPIMRARLLADINCPIPQRSMQGHRRVRA
ncbi:hypothetical protein EVAR_62347_1 [Eumeta japonica]|uniref:Uncharacterized protein n=1 Tax=Eumeta variegata TaxID=151549 RepID=A0A4C1ZP37_EUMVA|nr:hypothetical protein EVAR_62347_1 [Eumeta japonica]